MEKCVYGITSVISPTLITYKAFQRQTYTEQQNQTSTFYPKTKLHWKAYHLRRDIIYFAPKPPSGYAFLKFVCTFEVEILFFRIFRFFFLEVGFFYDILTSDEREGKFWMLWEMVSHKIIFYFYLTIIRLVQTIYSDGSLWCLCERAIKFTYYYLKKKKNQALLNGFRQEKDREVLYEEL